MVILSKGGEPKGAVNSLNSGFSCFGAQFCSIIPVIIKIDKNKYLIIKYLRKIYINDSVKIISKTLQK